MLHPQTIDRLHSDSAALTARLDHYALIRVSGDHAESFLQGQFSNDLSGLNSGAYQLTAYCNPKGRALALIKLIRDQSGFWMLVPDDLADALVMRLRMYVLRAKVALDPDPEMQALATFGEPVGIDMSHIRSSHAISDVPMPLRGTALHIVGKQQAEKMFGAAENHCNDELWRLINILSGVAEVYAATREAFIPQHISYDLAGGVSFRKGCYPGQEIVARLRYLGKNKHRLAILSGSGEVTPSAGDDIVADAGSAKKIGRIVDAVALADRSFYLSASLSTAVRGQDRIGLPCEHGFFPLTQLPLPYAAEQSD